MPDALPSIDFVKGSFGFRRQQPKIQHRLLATALGCFKHKSTEPYIVYDATAGLGRDAFLLALLGCEVYLMERHPTIATLLQTGIDHARQEPTLQPIIQRMHLIPGDARLLIPLLKTTYQPAHAIYLDPMFPTRKKSALVKKDMHALQMMVGADNDYDELLSLSLSEARTRVTVKRPIHAPPLGQKTPSFSVCGKCIRYDIYLTPR